MFINLADPAYVTVKSGTDFTYFFDETLNAVAKVRGVAPEEIKSKYKLLFYDVMIDYEVIKHFKGEDSTFQKEEWDSFIASENFPYSNAQFYHCFYHGDAVAMDLIDNKLIFDERKMLNITNPSAPVTFFNLDIVLKENLKGNFNDKVSPGADDGGVNGWQNYEDDTVLGWVKCLSRKIVINNGSEDVPYYLQEIIISDKGYPLTESIYNEIMSEQAK